MKFFKNCFIVAPLPQLMDHLINYAMECPLEKAIEVSKTLRERAYDSLISKYRNPVLILWGEKDKRRTLEALKKLEWCIPQAERICYLLDILQCGTAQKNTHVMQIIF